MSPELLYPDKYGLKDSRLTKQSDCYALGMVIYEVLSGEAPFTPSNNYVVMRKVLEGERPARPEGAEGAWFTDDLWRMLNRCWEAQLEHRPPIAVVLKCLDRVSKAPKAPSQLVDEDAGMDEDDWDPTSDSPGMLSWFSPRRFVAFLCRILCWLRP